jgi:predicted NUDIX family NTP pyrophosphohydrolase
MAFDRPAPFLGDAVQAERKRVTAFAIAGDIVATRIESVSETWLYPSSSG